MDQRNMVLMQIWSSYKVKLVYKSQPRDQQNVVLIHTWSLYASSNIHLGTYKMQSL